MASSRKVFSFGFILGIATLFLLEAVGVIAYGLYITKTPEEVAEILQPPFIPSSLEADYTLDLAARDGTTISLADMKGSVIYLSFWKPDCLSCKSQLPAVQRLYEQLQDEGIQFVLAAFGDSADDAFSVAEQYHVTAPVYIFRGERPKAYQSRAKPVAYVLSPDGKIAYRYEGAAQWDSETAVSYLRSLNSPNNPQ